MRQNDIYMFSPDYVILSRIRITLRNMQHRSTV